MEDGRVTYNLMFVINGEYDDVLPTLINNICNISSDIADNLKFNISYFGDKQASENLLNNLLKVNSNIKLKNIPSEFKDLTELIRFHYSKITHSPQIATSSVYYRFFLASTWPELSGNLLYLDADILVRESLSQLFALIPTDSKYPLLAPVVKHSQKRRDVLKFGLIKHNRIVNRILNKNEKIKKDYEKTNLDVKSYDFSNPMFNGGVWFYDLDIIRSGLYEDKMRICMEMQSIDKIFAHNDQGIMNVVFSDFYQLPSEWNSLEFGWKFLTKLPYDLSKIVHFNGPTKPWSKEIPIWMNRFAVDEWNKYYIKY